MLVVYQVNQTDLASITQDNPGDLSVDTAQPEVEPEPLHQPAKEECHGSDEDDETDERAMATSGLEDEDLAFLKHLHHRINVSKQANYPYDVD